VRADARANREALVAAARRLHAERGGDVPFSAVAQEAGVGIATLYRHFPTPLDLVVGVVEDVRDAVVAISDRWLPAVKDEPERGWPGFVSEMAALELGTFLPQLAEGQDPLRLPPELAELRSQMLAAVRDVLDAARRHGLVRADLTAKQFQLGLAVISRPLPHAQDVVPGLGGWLAEVYIRGLRPD
jgi:AcrR family transcriptional regulator